MENKKYNGWYNYETWSIALFFDNEEHLQERVKEIIKESEKEEFKNTFIQESLKELAEEIIDLENLNLYTQQLVNASLSEVNWLELQKHYEVTE